MVKISDAELEVMKVIWEKKETTSSIIIKELEKQNWTSNTIRTLIRRLYLKGAIKITGQEGKTFTYSSAVDEKKYKLFATKELIKRLYNNSIDEFILKYMESKEVSKEEKREIINFMQKLIEEN